MFVLGHVGIGRQLVRPWRTHLPAITVMVGMLLPDIIDKPLYYARLSPFISSTRTFGHTGLLLLALVAAAYLFRSRALAALSAGDAAHLFLDWLLDFLVDGPPASQQGSTWSALTWPLFERHFATVYLPSVASHVARLRAWPVIAGEVVGAALIGWELWQHRASTAVSAPAARAVPAPRASDL